MIRVRTLVIVLGLLAAAQSAQASVTVVGGGLAEACWQGVKAGRADPPLLQLCDRALEEEALRRRDRAGTHVNRGIILFRMQQSDRALADYARAERLTPSVGEIYVNRGAALIIKGDYAEAVAQIDRGLALGVEEAGKAYYNRAMAKEWLDDTRGAYFDYRKAAELDPTWEMPRTQLARFTVTTRR